MKKINITKELNIEKLKDEIKADDLAIELESYFFYKDSGYIEFRFDLSENEIESLMLILESHTTDSSQSQMVDVTITNVTSFVYALRNEFVKENILAGITQMNKTREVGTLMRDIDYWMLNKSLYEAMEEVDILIAKIEDPEQPEEEILPFISIERLELFKGKIQSFLAG